MEFRCPTRDAWQEILAALEATGEREQHLRQCASCQAVLEELTGGGVWRDLFGGLTEPALPLPSACQTVLEELTRRHVASELRNNSVSRNDKMTACIHIERMMHRNSIAVTGESAAAYTLIKLIPVGGAPQPMPLNLALVLDVSGSMYEEDGTGASRLKRVQDAAIRAIQSLRPQDTLAIIAFAHNAQVLLPSTTIADRDRIQDVIRRIDSFDVDPGGTAMDEGIALALHSIEALATTGRLSQIVVLTDGETSGEQNCRILAQHAAAKRIHLTLMGVGLDWKASLIKDLANLSQGKWHYIDVNESHDTERIFAAEFQALAATAFLDVEMRLRPMKDVRIKRVRQVSPEIRELTTQEGEDKTLLSRLGALQHDAATRFILDLSLPKRADGKYVIAHLELTYNLGMGERQSTGQVPLEISYTATGHGYMNAEVMKYIDEIQLKEMSDVLQIMLQKNDTQGAKQLAQEIITKGNQMGPAAAKKTKLAGLVLDELHSEGRVAKKTQLQLDDAIRCSEPS